MSALTDLFSAMATKIRSKTGTQTTYTPSEMASDGIDDVFDAGVASATTPITPSNSSPASMTANTGYKPTVNGVAVETVGSATASNINPPAVGVDVPIIMSSATGRQSVRIVDSITEVTPSNSSPVMLSANSIAQIKDAGVAISSYTGITPSNSSPVSLSSGSIYKTGASGYAISSYSSKTPSDTSPASVSSGAIIKASSSGYLVKNKPVDLGVPDLVSQVDMAASASRSITVTSKPKVVVLIESQRGSDGAQFLQIYDSVKDKYTTATYTAGGGYAHSDGTGLPGRITTVSTTTVTVKNASTGYAVRSSVLIYY